MKTFTGYFIFLFSFTFHSFLMSQTFLNGSFENTTASLACNYNLGNPTFNSSMSNTIGFGTGNELDILTNGCYVTGIPNGVRAVGVAAQYDEFSMAISAPLVTGTSYTISFWTYGETSSRSLGNLEIGTSIASTNFGTSIGIVSPIASAWTSHSLTFTASNNATFITVRNQMDGVIHWNHVDHFVFVNPLAVTIKSFEVTNENDRCAKLNWILNSQKNSDYFIIEKSKDGINCEVLGEYNAQGASSNKIDYVEYDCQPYSGTSYYRLIEVDVDGNKQYLDMKSVRFNKDEANQLNPFPNPANESFKVNIITDDLTQISVTNVVGQSVMNDINLENFGSSIGFDIRNLNPGVYYLQFNGNVTSFVKK